MPEQIVSTSTTTEKQMLLDHLRWLLCDVIPDAYRTEDKPRETVALTLEQVFDIEYQLKLVEGLSNAKAGEKLREFNAKKRRDKQTYLPYK
jgi:hypothetical protein